MPHGPDIAARPRLIRTTDEGAADMARYTTMRPTLDDAVREILTASATPPSPRRTGAPGAAAYPTVRRRGTGSAIRGAQTRSTTVRKPLRIPGR
ncbi:hypothetical protein [Nocardia neocaledoniensis]|uniref:hypothetical protein n=1 Tax=Nocardia neocaledoniensis TaxID=236511 RepID=UPI0024576229|nr:hypothetical protein [Nocardia neocaledoniensis]